MSKVDITQNQGEKKDKEGATHGRFGYLCFTPNWLQWLNNPWLFLVAVAVLTIGQAISVLGLLAIIMPQIEKRFNFSSFDIGMIAASNDVAAVAFGLLVSHYGNFGNKVKWVGVGGIITGIGFIIFTFPHYIIGKYEPPSVSVPSLVCTPPVVSNTTSDGCESDTFIAEWYYLALLLIGQFIAGVGSITLFAFAPAIFQECCSEKNIPIFIGVWQGSVFVGPMIAFGISEPILELYVDIDQPEGFNMTPLDPRWIANWWIGVVGSAVLVFLAAFVILGYPENLKKQDGVLEIGEKADSNDVDLTVKDKMKELPSTLKRLLNNWSFLFNCMGQNCTLMYAEGLAPFIAKILMLRYGLEATKIGNALTISTAPPLLIGVLAGSLLSRAFKPEQSGKKSAFIVFLFQIFTITGPMAFLIPGCEEINLAGWKVPYSQNSNMTMDGDVYLNTKCNSNCGCNLAVALPICGSDNITYLSGCYAGCSGITGFTSDNPPSPIFGNCSCVEDANNPAGGTATVGFCDQGCKNWLLFLILMAVVSMAVFLQLSPSKYVLMRCIEPEDLSFAFGFQYFLTKLFAHIPGPIIFGHVVDINCKIWQEVCDKTGYCWIYDMDAQMKMITTIAATLSCLGMLFYFLSWLLYKEANALKIHHSQSHISTAFDNAGLQREETKF